MNDELNAAIAKATYDIMELGNIGMSAAPAIAEKTAAIIEMLEDGAPRETV